MTSKDLATFAYVENNTSGEKTKPVFDSEPDDDQVAYDEAMRKGYLTEHESIYFGSKQFDVENVPVRYAD